VILSPEPGPADRGRVNTGPPGTSWPGRLPLESDLRQNIRYRLHRCVIPEDHFGAASGNDIRAEAARLILVCGAIPTARLTGLRPDRDGKGGPVRPGRFNDPKRTGYAAHLLGQDDPLCCSG